MTRADRDARRSRCLSRGWIAIWIVQTHAFLALKSTCICKHNYGELNRNAKSSSISSGNSPLTTYPNAKMITKTAITYVTSCSVPTLPYINVSLHLNEEHSHTHTLFAAGSDEDFLTSPVSTTVTSSISTAAMGDGVAVQIIVIEPLPSLKTPVAIVNRSAAES